MLVNQQNVIFLSGELLFVIFTLLLLLDDLPPGLPLILNSHLIGNKASLHRNIKDIFLQIKTRELKEQVGGLGVLV